MVKSEKLKGIIRSTKLFEKSDNISFSPFVSAEDGAEYDVWRVSSDEKTYVLKKAKESELSVYISYLKNASGVPRIIESVDFEDENYFIMEYVQGEPALRFDRLAITKALDALIAIQKAFWQTSEIEGAGVSFEESLAHRISRGKYLNDHDLEEAYDEFIDAYKALPRTLCHDDLLPFNIMLSEDSATVIDWEVAGILPYPVPLARLLAHAEESEDAFFYIKNEDKEFATRYYYDNLLKEKGIAEYDFRYSLALFVFYEYCEWIMLGNKYPDADMERYDKYMKKAKELLKR